MITTFSVLVENKFWVLTRIARIFSRHMFNITSLTVAPTTDENVSCMTIDVKETDERVKRMDLELRKIINVLSVHICSPEDYVQTEMVLVKISKKNPNFKQFIQEMEKFRARVIFQHKDMEIFEFSGDREQIQQFLKTSYSHDVISIVRTGSLAMPKKGSIAEFVKKEKKYDR
ncbi:acetolactate synthase small subunit [Candidatus Margulisiibacteriota bacterium]